MPLVILNVDLQIVIVRLYLRKKRRKVHKHGTETSDRQAACRMLRDVDVQDASTIVADDEEAVEHAERDRWHREEIHGNVGTGAGFDVAVDGFHVRCRMAAK